MFAGEAIDILWLCRVFWERSDCLALLHSFPSSLMTEQIKRYFWIEVLPRGSSSRLPLNLLPMKPWRTAGILQWCFLLPPRLDRHPHGPVITPVIALWLWGHKNVRENFQYLLRDIIPGTGGSSWGGCSNEPCRDNPSLKREMLQSPNHPCCPPPGPTPAALRGAQRNTD